jgi:hypothetical protein
MTVIKLSAKRGAWSAVSLVEPVLDGACEIS